MKKGVFRFKQFDCSHFRSSMKIGVDGVLLGAWAATDGAKRIIDIGTGCGVIALMCAQRNRAADILAVDIHPGSVEEAAENFARSPWGDRLRALQQDFTAMEERDFDLIVSNPPFFDSGVSNPETARERARHQAALSPYSLIEWASRHLSSTGLLAMIFPAEQGEEIADHARRFGLSLTRGLLVKGNPNVAPKRLLAEFSKSEKPTAPTEESAGIANFSSGGVEIPILTIENAPNDYTAEYKSLTGDFYLKF